MTRIPRRQKFQPPPFRHRQHPLAEVEPDHLGTAFGQRHCYVAGAATDIQGPEARFRPGQPDYPSFPIPVQPEALQVVDEVIARGDALEEFINLRRALLARIEIRVRHNRQAGLSQ
jgi:hypothetical protein